MQTPRRVFRLWASVFLVASLGCAAPTQRPAAGGFPVGSAVTEVDFDGTPLQLFSYKPADYVGDGFMLLFHGASRTAEAYRDNAAAMADELGVLVVVPLFDAERFPSRLYQFGGVFRADDSFADADERTFAFVPKLVDHIRRREGRPDLPHVMLGFSAGAQFLSRMAAFLDTDAERLIVMSPGSGIFPTRDMEYGLGFGGLPDAFSSDERIRRFLALPITLSVGTADTELSQLPTGDAYDQGVHRYSRNLRWFNEAMDLAYEKEWAFNWRLVVLEGPGHSPRDMFHHPRIRDAVFGHRR